MAMMEVLDEDGAEGLQPATSILPQERTHSEYAWFGIYYKGQGALAVDTHHAYRL